MHWHCAWCNEQFTHRDLAAWPGPARCPACGNPQPIRDKVRAPMINFEKRQREAVIREYNEALQDGHTDLAERIRLANLDVLGLLAPGEKYDGA